MRIWGPKQGYRADHILVSPSSSDTDPSGYHHFSSFFFQLHISHFTEEKNEFSLKRTEKP